MATEQTKSTSIVGMNPEVCILTDKQVACHSENLDATRNRVHNEVCSEPEEDDPTDLQSYNLDAHENLAINSPGDSINDEILPKPIDESNPHPLNPRSNHDCLSLSSEIPHLAAAGQNKATLPNKTRKVFILHFTNENDLSSQDAILQLASSLRSFHVDITLDLFEKDKFHGNWNMWYERELKESEIILCIITQDFYKELTANNHVKGNSAYNLMSDGNVPFIPIFLQSKVDKNHIPLSMRGANYYRILLRDIPNQQQKDGWNENFRSLYSFLTAQNRAQPPELGKVVAIPRRPSVLSEEDKKISQLKGITTPVMSIHSHNRMFAQLASNLTADWESLGRTLGVSEANMYAIRRDYMHSVTEQAVKMFQQWLKQNGSRATIQALATAVYETGSQYHNLLTVLHQYTK